MIILYNRGKVFIINFIGAKILSYPKRLTNCIASSRSQKIKGERGILNLNREFEILEHKFPLGPIFHKVRAQFSEKS